MRPIVFTSSNLELFSSIGYTESIFLDDDESPESFRFWTKFWNSEGGGDNNQLVLDFWSRYE